MNKKKWTLGLLLTILGFIGIASLLTMDIPLPPEAEALLQERFTPWQIKLLLLINPTILLILAVTIGTILYDKAELRVPLFEKWIGLKKETVRPPEVLTYGVSGGLLSGILISVVGVLFYPVLPLEFKELGESLQPSLMVRFLYGGFTEEILMRFGLMTFLVWIASFIFKGTRPVVYWIGIIIAAVLFALGHFPIAFQSVSSPSAALLSYILIGNVIGGIIFGWLYWKKGLESAFVAHLFAHVVMVLAEPLLN